MKENEYGVLMVSDFLKFRLFSACVSYDDDDDDDDDDNDDDRQHLLGQRSCLGPLERK